LPAKPLGSPTNHRKIHLAGHLSSPFSFQLLATPSQFIQNLTTSSPFHHHRALSTSPIIHHGLITLLSARDQLTTIANQSPPPLPSATIPNTHNNIIMPYQHQSTSQIITVHTTTTAASNPSTKTTTNHHLPSPYLQTQNPKIPELELVAAMNSTPPLIHEPCHFSARKSTQALTGHTQLQQLTPVLPHLCPHRCSA
jgi:hypothetical protein